MFGPLYNWQCTESILKFVLIQCFCISWCWKYFPSLWGTGISDAIFPVVLQLTCSKWSWSLCVFFFSNILLALRLSCILYLLYFSLLFVLSDHGEVLNIYYEHTEVSPVLSAKKTILNLMSSKLVISKSQVEKGQRWAYGANEAGHEGKTCQFVYNCMLRI